LIDAFIEDGHCDLVAQLARLFPPRVLYRVMFGIDDDEEVERNQAWVHKMVFEPDAPDNLEAMTAWWSWINDFIAGRRAAPRREDMIDALLYGRVQGRALSDEEIGGAIRILILGGFDTTSNATASIMLRLAKDPALQCRLRKDPSLIPTIFDEILRLEPPVVSLPRLCTRDVVLGGQQIKKGEAVLMHFGAANRDPGEFDRPADFQVERPRNRHLSFGGGPHRCIGSNLARLNLRVVFEEILSRMDDIRVDDSYTPDHDPAGSWGLASLPLTFSPGRHLG
jgi:cytochrome P450